MTSFIQGSGAINFSGITDASGKVHIETLPPGEYWLAADLLGLSVGYECFHVASRSSFRAKRNIKYTWGDFPSRIASTSGKVSYSQPGTGGSLLENVIHRVTIPIKNANLKLQSPFSDRVYSAQTGALGEFSFGSVPDGLYVLHVEGGQGGSYDPSDSLIELKSVSGGAPLLLTYQQAGAGCGNSTLTLSEGHP